MFEICQNLRKARYHSLTIDVLGFCICTAEAHLTLMNIKYLEWRVKLYVELALSYQEMGSNEVALRTVEHCQQKVKELQDVLSQDPPLGLHVKKIFDNVTRTLRILEVKFRL
jgi:hypothetical protein